MVKWVECEDIMKTRKCTRYIAECGKGFWNKESCLAHEGDCMCWTNPKNRTCKTCEYGFNVPFEDDTGAGGMWECENMDNSNDGHISWIEGVDYISVNCNFYKQTQAKAR